MARVLVAQSVDWIGTARLLPMLAAAGVSCDLMDRGGSYASASWRARKRIAVDGAAEAIALEVLRVASDYKAVVLTDEVLIRNVIRLGGKEASRILGGPRANVRTLCNKTLFSPAARAAGLRVADFEVAESAAQAAQAAQRLGGRVVVKGRWGAGGRSVRMVDSSAAASIAADEVGCPVLVERFVDGELINMPCLYSRGKLVAAMAARKLELTGENGPSSINEFLPIDDRILRTAQAIGAAFSMNGFASADAFLVDDGDPVILEINPRPVPQLHIGTSVGVDMGRAYADVLAKRWDGTPRLADRGRVVRLFPQNLLHQQEALGRREGTRAWRASSGAFIDMPWNDPGLLLRDLRRMRGDAPA
ncbi:MAG: ATP-grasp domain-containing protein [Coriobacteriia bacterium]|nr:ATP-grasp domain-containing protein [Coriobacteriia bacterium]